MMKKNIINLIQDMKTEIDKKTDYNIIRTSSEFANMVNSFFNLNMTDSQLSKFSLLCFDFKNDWANLENYLMLTEIVDKISK